MTGIIISLARTWTRKIYQPNDDDDKALPQDTASRRLTMAAAQPTRTYKHL